MCDYEITSHAEVGQFYARLDEFRLPLASGPGCHHPHNATCIWQTLGGGGVSGGGVDFSSGETFFCL